MSGFRLETVGLPLRSWYRWKEAGRLGVDQADEAAVLFGCHPSEIWGNAYYEAAAIADGVAS